MKKSALVDEAMDAYGSISNSILGQVGKTIAMAIPGPVGATVFGADALKNVHEGNFGQAAVNTGLAGLSMVPGGGLVGKGVAKAVGLLPKAVAAPLKAVGAHGAAAVAAKGGRWGAQALTSAAPTFGQTAARVGGMTAAQLGAAHYDANQMMKRPAFQQQKEEQENMIRDFNTWRQHRQQLQNMAQGPQEGLGKAAAGAPAPTPGNPGMLALLKQLGVAIPTAVGTVGGHVGSLGGRAMRLGAQGAELAGRGIQTAGNVALDHPFAAGTTALGGTAALLAGRKMLASDHDKEASDLLAFGNRFLQMQREKRAGGDKRSKRLRSQVDRSEKAKLQQRSDNAPIDVTKAMASPTNKVTSKPTPIRNNKPEPAKLREPAEFVPPPATHPVLDAPELPSAPVAPPGEAAAPGLLARLGLGMGNMTQGLGQRVGPSALQGLGQSMINNPRTTGGVAAGLGVLGVGGIGAGVYASGKAKRDEEDQKAMQLMQKKAIPNPLPWLKSVGGSIGSGLQTAGSKAKAELASLGGNTIGNTLTNLGHDTIHPDAFNAMGAAATRAGNRAVTSGDTSGLIPRMQNAADKTLQHFRLGDDVGMLDSLKHHAGRGMRTVGMAAKEHPLTAGSLATAAAAAPLMYGAYRGGKALLGGDEDPNKY